eukprot:g80425.t1
MLCITEKQLHKTQTLQFADGVDVDAYYCAREPLWDWPTDIQCQGVEEAVIVRWNINAQQTRKMPAEPWKEGGGGSTKKSRDTRPVQRYTEEQAETKKRNNKPKERDGDKQETDKAETGEKTKKNKKQKTSEKKEKQTSEKTKEKTGKKEKTAAGKKDKAGRKKDKTDKQGDKTGKKKEEADQKEDKTEEDKTDKKEEAGKKKGKGRKKDKTDKQGDKTGKKKEEADQKEDKTEEDNAGKKKGKGRKKDRERETEKAAKADKEQKEEQQKQREEQAQKDDKKKKDDQEKKDTEEREAEEQRQKEDEKEKSERQAAHDSIDKLKVDVVGPSITKESMQKEYHCRATTNYSFAEGESSVVATPLEYQTAGQNPSRGFMAVLQSLKAKNLKNIILEPGINLVTREDPETGKKFRQFQFASLTIVDALRPLDQLPIVYEFIWLNEQIEDGGTWDNGRPKRVVPKKEPVYIPTPFQEPVKPKTKAGQKELVYTPTPFQEPVKPKTKAGQKKHGPKKSAQKPAVKKQKKAGHKKPTPAPEEGKDSDPEDPPSEPPEEGEDSLSTLDPEDPPFEPPVTISSLKLIMRELIASRKQKENNHAENTHKQPHVPSAHHQPMPSLKSSQLKLKLTYALSWSKKRNLYVVLAHGSHNADAAFQRALAFKQKDDTLYIVTAIEHVIPVAMAVGPRTAVFADASYYTQVNESRTQQTPDCYRWGFEAALATALGVCTCTFVDVLQEARASVFTYCWRDRTTGISSASPSPPLLFFFFDLSAFLDFMSGSPTSLDK